MALTLKKNLLIFFLLLLQINISAQSTRPVESVLINGNQELGIISVIKNDQIGYTWIGTTSGLYRYDGKSVLPASDLFNNHHLTNYVNDILIVKNIIWLSTHEGLFAINTETKQNVKVYPNIYTADRYFQKPYTTKLAELGHKIWVGTHFGFECIDPQERKVSSYPFFDNYGFAENRRHISNIITNNHGLYFGTTSGLYTLNVEKKEYTQLDINNPALDLKASIINCIYPISDSILLLGSWGNGLLLYNIINHSAISYLYESHNKLSGTDNIVLGIERKDDDQYYIGTATKSVIEFNLNNKSFDHYPENPYHHESVYAISYKNHLLYGDNVGLKSQITIDENIKFYETKNIQGDKSIIASAEDSIRKMVYLGTYEDGIWTYNYTNNTIEKFKNGQLESGIINNLIFKNGLLYINTSTQNYIFDPEKNEISVNEYLPHLNYYLAESISDSTIIFTPFFSYSYIYNINRKSHSKITCDDTSFIKNISSVHVDNNNKLWFGTFRNGIGMFNPLTKKIEHKKSHLEKIPIHDIYSISSDKNNNIWFGTHRQGLFKYNPSANKIENIREFSGIQINSVYNIKRDKFYNFWLCTNKGLVFLNPETNLSKITNTADGLYDNLLDNGCSFIKGKSQLLLHHYNGYSIVNTSAIKTNNIYSHFMLNRFAINNREINIKGDTIIQLKYYENELRFEPILLNTRKPKYVQYYYKLEGYHSDWINNNSNNSILISKLPDGKYTLYLKAIDHAGNEFLYPFQVTVKISPPFWQTTWFYLLIFTICLIVLYLFYQYRIGQIKNIFKVRNKIANDLHDEVGSSLSSIKMYSSFLQSDIDDKNLIDEIYKKIETTSQESIDSIADIVWSINPKNDKLENVWYKMKAFSDNLAISNEIKMNYNIDIDPTGNLPMELRKNIYLIYKEAINNSVKYSKTKTIDVSFIKKSSHYELVIHDYGIGFDPKQMTNTNGLDSMQDRAKQMNAQINILTDPTGTKIRLTFKC